MLKIRDDWVAEHHVWDELEFPPMNGEQHPVKRGRYWRIWGDVERAKNGIETWNVLKPAFLAHGWTVFDFNKSTLEPASDAVLRQVADLVAKDKTLKIEVQGHTDNVGGDAYNQTLSQARARAVADWLIKQGVESARLSARGYGKTRPVADNNNDDGRAKNRRVEIADPACGQRRPNPNSSPFADSRYLGLGLEQKSSLRIQRLAVPQ